ncbi:MAG: transglycosylase SLT domain-containing protein [[Eubacterium] sulci]|nr:transglycosylase SLT domain-containing protein [[Eubacterium] sulci]MBF1181401.1 transglycosylase SLT domain-containing protein [[Eubacterium] sulci]
MKIKSIIPPTIFISAVLALNGIATAIDHPELYNKIEPKVVSNIQIDVRGISNEMIDDIAIRSGVDPNIVKAIIKEESGGNPNAVGDNGESIGLMQIQPKHYQKRMEELGIVSLFDPQENVILGCAILSDLYDQYGNYEDALSVYNSGNTEDGKAYAERILNR